MGKNELFDTDGSDERVKYLDLAHKAVSYTHLDVYKRQVIAVN